jgi:hypothetical protein
MRDVAEGPAMTDAEWEALWLADEEFDFLFDF